ncbi:signal peptidase I [Coriobacteriia bacterium Es71-Z0120]|uniref:signal peptidase I n=1 Tax=Parvivirga hydrogeniphila TaxID=2939460 RepID=UPI002260B60C|nr:signal peptidase I [Parvivirga hydrogeniphila]MCL4079254.1 signal peptidase I [Parvivirga hydrogeniphila]
MGSGERASAVFVRRALGAVALVVWALVLTRYGATVVRGSSMEPALVPYDVAVYRRGPVSIRVGDAVLFEHDGWPGGVIHRVRAVLPGGLLRTQGDANPAPDRDPVPRSQVRGVVCAVVPIGRVSQYAHERIDRCAILNRQSKTATR